MTPARSSVFHSLPIRRVNTNGILLFARSRDRLKLSDWLFEDHGSFFKLSLSKVGSRGYAREAVEGWPCKATGNRLSIRVVLMMGTTSQEKVVSTLCTTNVTRAGCWRATWPIMIRVPGQPPVPRPGPFPPGPVPPRRPGPTPHPRARSSLAPLANVSLPPPRILVSTAAAVSFSRPVRRPPSQH